MNSVALLETVKPLWIEALTNHNDATLSMKGDEPRQISMMARRATLTKLDLSTELDAVANYFFVIGCTPAETVDMIEGDRIAQQANKGA